MMKKPYVVVMLKQDHRKRYALSRNYNLMKDDEVDIDACKIGDIVQVCGGRAASFCYPDWCDGYPDKAFISIWFNYYD